MASHSEQSPDRGPRSRLTPALFTAALALFALPFLTVTCYGDDVTVSGVQAATKVDLYPSDPNGEQELTREEPPNAFAFLALVATGAGLIVSFGAARSRRSGVVAAATAVIALAGLLLYAFYRTWGEALPGIGLAGSMVLLVGAAWVGAVEAVPPWISRAVGLLAAATIPVTLLHNMTIDFGPWLFLLFYAGLIVAVALAVGAVKASVRFPLGDRERPSSLRIVLAGLAGLACLGAAGVATPLLLGSMVSGDYVPGEVGEAYVFAILVLAIYVGAGFAAWAAGRAIAHGRRRQPFASVRTQVGV